MLAFGEFSKHILQLTCAKRKRYNKAVSGKSRGYAVETYYAEKRLIVISIPLVGEWIYDKHERLDKQETLH